MIKIHPKKRKWLMKRLLWVGLLLLILIIVWGGIELRNKSLVSQLKIEIVQDEDKDKFVGSEEVKGILFKNFGHYIEGQVIERINVKSVESVLEQDPYIKDAEVYIDARNQVNIKIVQRKPLIRVMDLVDETYYLDEGGKKMPFTTRYVSRTLVASGDIGMYNDTLFQKKEGRLYQVLELAKEIQKHPFLKVQIGQINVEYNGEAILVPILGNHLIEFGYLNENVADKLFNLMVFYEKGLPYEGWEKYKSISLAFKGQVVAKRKQVK
jgi:cell division protein FtsQ